MAAVVLLFVCGWISIVTAQPNIMVSLLPQDHQTVCLGESISYNCAGNGTSIALNSPPIISESNPLTVLTRDGVEHCSVRANSAAGIILVDPTESSLFMVTFTLYVSDEQSEGERTVFCSVSSLDGMGTANTTFSVLGAPTAVTSFNFQKTASLSEQVLVNISWNSPQNAQEFMLQIKNTGYNNTIPSLKNSVTVLLPYGTYSATLCTINRCGKTCQDYPNIFSAERPKDTCNSSVVIALAVVVGILGLLFIIIFIYAVVVTVKISKKDKTNAGAIDAKEMD